MHRGSNRTKCPLGPIAEHYTVAGVEKSRFRSQSHVLNRRTSNDQTAVLYCILSSVEQNEHERGEESGGHMVETATIHGYH